MPLIKVLGDPSRTLEGNSNERSASFSGVSFRNSSGIFPESPSRTGDAAHRRVNVHEPVVVLASCRNSCDYCDLAGLLLCSRTGNWPRTKMAGEMAGSNFGVGSQNSRKWSGKCPDMQKNTSCLAICLAILEPAEKWPPDISPAISQPFLVRGRLPIPVAGQPSRNAIIS